MLTRLLDAQAFNAVQPGSTPNLSLPVGGTTYYALFIEYLHTASTAATETVFGTDIENVKIRLDGEPLWDIAGSDLVDLNNFYGYPMANGVFPIMFARPEFLDPLEELRFALGTRGIGQMTVELKLAAAAVAPELKATVLILSGQDRALGQVVRVRKTPAGAATAGLKEFHDFPLVGPEPGRGLKAVHFKTANITEHEIKMNGAELSEGKIGVHNLAQDILAFQTVSRNPVAGYHHVDFAGNRYSGIVPTTNAKELRFGMTFSAADAAFDVIHEEVLGVPDL